MVEYVYKHKLLSPIQFGICAKFSTPDTLLFATENIRSENNNYKMVAAAFFDLSKALINFPESVPKNLKVIILIVLQLP